jgi:hypothetical protein
MEAQRETAEPAVFPPGPLVDEDDFGVVAKVSRSGGDIRPTGERRVKLDVLVQRTRDR